MERTPKKCLVWIFPFFIAALTLVGVFVLPFAFPPTQPVYSSAYLVGFNNRAADICAAGISLFVLAISYLWREGTNGAGADKTIRPQSSRLSYKYLGFACLASVLWIGLLSWLVLRSSSRVVDDFYFIPQLQKVAVYHMKLYSQVEFAYGPLLFYPTIWLSKLIHWRYDSVSTAYYITLLLHHVLGLGMLYYVVNRLQMTRTMRVGMFIAIGLISLDPELSLSYTLTRFILPYFAITVLERIRNPALASLFCFASVEIVLGTSTEMGVAFGVGALVYSCYRLFRNGWRWGGIIPAVLLGAYFLVRIEPPEYLASLSHFSHGFLNTVLTPTPILVLSLLCVVWLAPRLIARCIGTNDPQTALLAGFYAISLTLLPSMLSLPVHIVCTGIGLYLLAGVYLSNWRFGSPIWVATLAAIFPFWLCNKALFWKNRYEPAIVCADRDHVLLHAGEKIGIFAHAGNLDTQEGYGCPSPIDPAKLYAILGSQRFEIPFGVRADIWVRVEESPQYVPGYFNAEEDMWGPDAEQIKIDDLRKVNWLLMGDKLQPQMSEPVSSKILGFRRNYKTKPPLYYDGRLVHVLQTDWTPVAPIADGVWLYTRRQPPAYTH
jgi:hypothetical protein